jgi:Spy/CpxP family protein refolding chaperone
MRVVLLRAVLTVMCAAALTIPSFAQTGSGTTPSTRNPFSHLQKALNLSSAQVSQLQGLLQSQRTAMQPLVADVKTKRQALQTALQGNDASAIGSALLALRSSEATAKSARTADHNALMAVLTPAQAQIVNDYLTLANAGGARPLGGGFGGHFAGRWRHAAGA